MKSIVRLESEQVGQAAALLASAFRNDSLYVAVTPEAARRIAVLTWLFECVVRYALLYGETYTTKSMEGIACWFPPGQTKLTFGRIMRSGLYTAPLKMGLAAYHRFDKYLSYADELHERHAPKSHRYLWALGVDPPNQGKGIGSQLLEAGLARADTERAACYLETGLERSVRFYEKFGFKVMGEGESPGSGVHVWAMLRASA